MSAEIRKLKDGSTTVYPLTLGNAVNLDDGTTVQDLADRSNKNQIKLNRNEPMRVVVTKCIPQHPKIGMRYYYPGGVFGVKYKKRVLGERDQDFIKLYYVLYGDGELHEVSSPQNTSYFLTAGSNDVPGIDYDRDLPDQSHRKPYLLVEIVDSTVPNCHQINTSGGGKFYCTIKQVRDLNCDTYSPYFKVIGGRVKNVEQIPAPGNPGYKKNCVKWEWLEENFPKDCNVGNKFRYYKSGPRWQSGDVLKYNGTPVGDTERFWFFDVYNTKEKRNKLIRPKGVKRAKFSLLRYKIDRTFSGSGNPYIYGHRTYPHIRKVPFKVLYAHPDAADGYHNRYVYAQFVVNTFRRGRKSINYCPVQVVAYQTGFDSGYQGYVDIRTDSSYSGYAPVSTINQIWT